MSWVICFFFVSTFMMQKPKGPITCVCACILYKFILYSLCLAQFPAQAVSFRVRKKKKKKEALSVLIIKCILINIYNYFIKVFRSSVLNYFANVETKILWNLFLIYFALFLFFFFLVFLYYLFFWFFIFSWRIIALQHCIGFYQTSTWVNLWLFMLMFGILWFLQNFCISVKKITCS